MRALLLTLPFSILTLFPISGNAADSRPRQIAAISDSEKPQEIIIHPNHETYRGYYLDLSQIAARRDFLVMADALRHQLDIIESVGLSPRVLNFFHTVPVLVDDAACLDTKHADNENSDDRAPILAAACYGPVNLQERTSHEPTVMEGGKWTNLDQVALAEDTGLGVVSVRPIALDGPTKNAQRPVILHEMFHAYHAQSMPHGFKNPSILFYYNQAKSKQLYPDDAYLMTDEKEFFAVTASVLLSGMADGGATPTDIKQKQPDYFNYLRWLFEIDPNHSPGATPVASAD